jgi:adenosylcobinamide amidohydrolase
VNQDSPTTQSFLSVQTMREAASTIEKQIQHMIATTGGIKAQAKAQADWLETNGVGTIALTATMAVIASAQLSIEALIDAHATAVRVGQKFDVLGKGLYDMGAGT